MVALERICPLYAMIRLYSNSYSEEELNIYVQEIKYLLNTFNITETSQEEDVSVFLAGLGV